MPKAPLLAIDALEKTFESGSYRFGPNSFALEAGGVVAFVGQNGSGKSTLFNLITANLEPSAGRVLFDGEVIRPEAVHLKRKIGYMPQNPFLPRWVTGEEILRYAASLYELKDATKVIAEALRYWDAESYRHKPLTSCSHGMQKRIALALASLHQPPLVILDEPYSGLDIYHIRALDDMIRTRQAAGLTTILSTHIAPYTARMCEQVFVVKDGKVEELLPWQGVDYEQRIASIEGLFV